MIEDFEVIERIKIYFEENYELLRLEGGHAVTEDIKQLALTQVLYYFTKMKDVANKVTDTEVKLTLPDQRTPQGRNFTIEGIVDIVRDDDETWMYDIKTHDLEYIQSNKDHYEKQLNVYAHIWQELRGQALDKTAIISTAYPEGLRQAHLLNDQYRIQYELSRWNPMVDLDFDQLKVQDVIDDFAETVDYIEDKKFRPAPTEKLRKKMEGTNALFGTRVCRNCDARFSCASYREYATSKGKGERGSFRKYFDDFGSDTDKEEWANANLQARNPDNLDTNLKAQMAHERIKPEFLFDEEKINQLKQIAPECFEDGKVNFESLRQNLGDWAQDEEDAELEHFGLFWPGKKNARRFATIPPEGTLEPAYGEGLKADGSPDDDGKNDSKNIFIEGENLEVLKILQKSYTNKIKMIYIDPPYNTGNDFVYDDDFTEPLQEYLRRTGQIDEEGKPFTTNKKSDGRFHSKWLSMIYPRLRLARNLLKENGVIFVSIDDNEVHNLRALMNEIYGEESFVAQLVWKKRVSPANDSHWFSSDHEYILVFARDKEEWQPNRMERNEKQNSYYKNPDDDPRGPWNSAAYTCNKNKDERPNLYYSIINPFTSEEVWPRETAVWAYSKDTHAEHVKQDILYWGSDGKSKSPRKKQFLTEAKKVVNRSFLDHSDVGSTQSATLDFLKLFDHNYFNYTKPLDLIKRLIEIGSGDNDIILDFFAGSATTAHAALELNNSKDVKRKFICVQLPEEIDQKTQAYKDGYSKISDISRERIIKVCDSIELKAGFHKLNLTFSNYKKWKDIQEENISQLENSLDLFNSSPLREDWSKNKLIMELILLEGFPLDASQNKSKIGSNEIVKVESEMIANALHICLDEEIEEHLIEQLQLDNASTFVCLDSAISNQNKLRLSDKGLIKTI